MSTHFSFEITTRQKIKELRKEADMQRLINQGAAGGQKRSNFTDWFLSSVFGKLGIQQGKQQVERSAPVGEIVLAMRNSDDPPASCLCRRVIEMLARDLFSCYCKTFRKVG